MSGSRRHGHQRSSHDGNVTALNDVTSAGSGAIITDAARTKLNGIEASATGDQTGAEIKALYELEANAFTDAQFTKLAGIEAGATGDQTGAEIKLAYEAEAKAFTDAQYDKLDAIEAGATADRREPRSSSLTRPRPRRSPMLYDKLAAIADNATANQTDAHLLARATTRAPTRVHVSDHAEVSNTDVAANTAKVSADGLVTTHSDVTDAGSGDDGGAHEVEQHRGQCHG